MKICSACLQRFDDGTATCPDDGEKLFALGEGDPRLGTLVADRFVVLSVLGRGGMSVVYRAYQRNTYRFVALKVLAMSETDTEMRREEVLRFQREARSAANLTSPHTIVVHDSGPLGDDAMYIAMELIKGQSLGELIITEAPIGLKRALQLIRQVCLSLEEAHESGLIHRDIKPNNIMVDARDHAKVLDFGLVKVSLAGESALTRPDVIMGTPAYMAPEMWARQFGEVSQATDIYAVGAVLFELLTGHRVFSQSSVPQLMHAHVYEVPRPLTDLATALHGHPWVQDLVGRCLAKDPKQRYPTAAELRADLEGAIDYLNLADSQPPTQPRVGVPAGQDDATISATNIRLPSMAGPSPAPIPPGPTEARPPPPGAMPPPAVTEAADPRPAKPSPQVVTLAPEPLPPAVPARSNGGLALAGIAALALIVVGGWLVIGSEGSGKATTTALPDSSSAAMAGGPAPLDASQAQAALKTAPDATAVAEPPPRVVDPPPPRVDPAPPPKAPSPPPPAAPPPVRPPSQPTKVTMTKAIGIDRGRAKEVVASLSGPLRRCLGDAQGDDFEVKLILFPGRAPSVRTTPSESAFEGCAKDAAAGTVVTDVSGSFATVILRVHRS